MIYAHGDQCVTSLFVTSELSAHRRPPRQQSPSYSLSLFCGIKYGDRSPFGCLLSQTVSKLRIWVLPCHDGRPVFDHSSRNHMLAGYFYSLHGLLFYRFPPTTIRQDPIPSCSHVPLVSCELSCVVAPHRNCMCCYIILAPSHHHP